MTCLNWDKLLQGLTLLAAFAAAGFTFYQAWIAKDTERNELRPYVFVKGMKYLSHFDPTANYYWWSIAPAWENSGSTPTKNLLLNINSYLEDTSLPDEWVFPPNLKDYTTRTPLGPKSSMQGAEIHVKGTDLLAVQNGKKHLYIWGQATYNDIFQGTPQHITKFCYEVAIRGDPTKPISETNIVEMIFMAYKKHNCADDECKN